MAGSGRYGRMVEYVDYHKYDPSEKFRVAREAREAKEKADEKEQATQGATAPTSAPATGAPSDRQPGQKQEKKPKVKAVAVLLHIPEDLLQRIDTIVDGLPIKASRRAWIMAQIAKGTFDFERIAKRTSAATDREEMRAIFINPETGKEW